MYSRLFHLKCSIRSLVVKPKGMLLLAKAIGTFWFHVLKLIWDFTFKWKGRVFIEHFAVYISARKDASLQGHPSFVRKQLNVLINYLSYLHLQLPPSNR